MKEYQQCARCVMDTTDPDIQFDGEGVCNHCKSAKDFVDNLRKRKKEFDLDAYVRQMKRDGQGKEYDCVAGISGGVDSCYVICKLRSLGIRTLAVHIDNGWNTELSVYNIKKLMELTDTDLYTYVLNWQEFRDLQLAFLKASTPDSEIPFKAAFITGFVPFIALDIVKAVLAAQLVPQLRRIINHVEN